MVNLWSDSGIRQREKKMRMTSVLILLVIIILATATGRPAWSEQVEDIRSERILRIATNQGIEPMEYRQNGNLIGYDIDLGDELAKHLGAQAK